MSRKSMVRIGSARRGQMAAGGLLMVVMFAAAPLSAATFNIANGDVAGLSAAISTAQGNGEADVINLATGGTYVITSGSSSNAFPAITTQITINGNGALIERSSAGGTP